MAARGDPLTEPTDDRFRHSGETKTLRPWYDPETGFSQEPFLAAPEGFDSPVTSDALYHAFISGIGAGKTTAGIIRVIANTEKWNPGELGMIIAPTTPALKNVILPEMRKWGVLDSFEFRGKGSDEPGLHTPSGARIILESADNDRKIERLRGPSIAWAWIDEAASLPKKVWDIVVGRLRVGRYRNAFITTTPKGHDWVYERFYGGGDGPPADVNLIYGVPSTANPELPDDYEDVTAEYSGQFRAQEVEGRFVQPEGLVYPNFGESNIVEETPENPARVLFGVDWGYNAPSVILAIIETRTGEWFVVDEFFERHVTDADLAEVAQRMVGRWGGGTFYCDPAQPQSVEEFQRAGLDATGAENPILPGIKTVSSRMDSLRVRETCANLIKELNSYHYPEDDDTADKPVDANNHAADALRYALHTAKLRGGLNAGVASMSEKDFYR